MSDYGALHLRYRIVGRRVIDDDNLDLYTRFALLQDRVYRALDISTPVEAWDHDGDQFARHLLGRPRRKLWVTVEIIAARSGRASASMISSARDQAFQGVRPHLGERPAQDADHIQLLDCPISSFGYLLPQLRRFAQILGAGIYEALVRCVDHAAIIGVVVALLGNHEHPVRQ